jgi:hypothetical protein
MPAFVPVGHKKIRQIKQQVKEGIPYFDELPCLVPALVEFITVEPMPLVTLQKQIVTHDWDEDKRKL